MLQIAQAAWSAPPGVFYLDTMNAWHTFPGAPPDQGQRTHVFPGTRWSHGQGLYFQEPIAAVVEEEAFGVTRTNVHVEGRSGSTGWSSPIPASTWSPGQTRSGSSVLHWQWSSAAPPTTSSSRRIGDGAAGTWTAEEPGEGAQPAGLHRRWPRGRCRLRSRRRPEGSAASTTRALNLPEKWM